MNRRMLLERWPSWANRWYGWLSRVLILLFGSLSALVVISIANFGAIYGSTEPEWDGETLSILWLGVGIGIATVLVAWKPSRATLSLAGLTTILGFAVMVPA